MYADSTVFLGGDSSARTTTFFNGQVDELVLFSRGTRSPLPRTYKPDMVGYEEGVLPNMSLPLAATLSFEMSSPKNLAALNLVAYYRFNEALGATVSNDVVNATAGALGVMGSEDSQPTRVPSTIAMSNELATMEGEALAFTLEGVSSYDAVPQISVEVGPRHGRLTVAGHVTALRAGSKAPADSVLVYMPNANFHGEDSFIYRVDDCCAPSSAPVRVSVSVASKDEAPALLPMDPTEVDFQSAEPVAVTFGARRLDGERFNGTFSVTTLPKYGLLYTHFDGMRATGRINSRTNQTFAARGMNHLTLYYVPVLNTEGKTDSFEYVATDGHMVSAWPCAPGARR